MQTLNNAELAFLSVVGHTELTTRVLRLYASGMFLFSGMTNPHLDLMWNAFIKTMKNAKTEGAPRPGVDTLAADMIEAVQGEHRMPEELKDRCDGMLQRLLDGDIPDMQEGIMLVKRLTQLETNRRMVVKMNSNADLTQLQQTLDASKKTMSVVDEGGSNDDADATGVLFRPLRDIRKLARKVERVPTGINWLDDISSGGGRVGDLWLVLGPPGGGKTISAVQYACAQSMLGNHTLWATYEQTIEGDIAERMIANITDTSLEHIRDVGFDNLDPSIQEGYWSAVGGVEEKLIGLDMTKVKRNPQDPDDYGGVQTLWNYYKQLKAEGVAPKSVILDWFGSMMSKISANLGMDLSQCYRFKAQEEINLLIQFAKQEKLLVIVFHQLNTEAADARPTFLANATHAQDMKNMQNFFDLVAVLGTRDENNILYFSSPKARKGGRIVRTLKMVGEKSRLVMEHGWLPDRRGSFYKPGSMSENVSVSSLAQSYVRELE